MSELRGDSEPIVTFEAVVTRCGCGDPDSHNGVRGPSGACPHPQAVEDLGVIARSDVPGTSRAMLGSIKEIMKRLGAGRAKEGGT